MVISIRSSLAAIAFCILVSPAVYAQEGSEHLSPFANGAGRTYAVTARGLDATGINPSLLALGTPRHIELSIFPISSFGANAGPSFRQLNTFTNSLGGGSLSDSTRATLVDLLLNNKFSGRVDARLFGLSYGNPDLGTFALTWDMHLGAQAFLPDSLLNFFGEGAKGNLLSQILQTQTSLDLQGLWYSEYGLSYGRALFGNQNEGDLELDAGLGLKYVQGIGYTRLDPSSFVSINVDQARYGGGKAIIRAKYKLQFAYPDAFDPKNTLGGFSLNLLTGATAGTGYGGDVGFLLHPYSKNGTSPWSIGISIADIGNISWTKHTDVRSLDTLVIIQYDSIKTNHVNDVLKPLNGKLDTTDAPFTSLLPTTLHIAMSLNLAGIGISIAGVQISAATEFAKGLTSTVGSPQNGRFGFGLMLERPSDAIAFHTALGMTSQDKITDLTFAVGVGFWNRVLLDLSTNGLGGVLSSTGRSDAAFGMKVLF